MSPIRALGDAQNIRRKYDAGLAERVNRELVRETGNASGDEKEKDQKTVNTESSGDLGKNVDLQNFYQISGTNFLISKERWLKGKSRNDVGIELGAYLPHILIVPSICLFMQHIRDVLAAANGERLLLDGTGGAEILSEVRHRAGLLLEPGERERYPANFGTHLYEQFYLNFSAPMFNGINTEGISASHYYETSYLITPGYISINFVGMVPLQSECEGRKFSEKYQEGKNIFFRPPNFKADKESEFALFHVGNNKAGIYCDNDYSANSDWLGVFPVLHRGEQK